MRSDQYMGLTVEAQNFLDLHEERSLPCPHCGRTYPVKLEVCAYYNGMFDDEYPLYQHFLTNGCTAEEFLQADPWSSGPCFFIGLRVYDIEKNLIQEFLWSQRVIDNV
jgi:hypothetical protein